MRDEFEKLVVAGRIGRQHVEPLAVLAQSGYCMHRSWGFGKITTVDAVMGRLSIDFPGKPGHSMDLGFAAESLKPIPSDHILARKAADLNALRQMAALHHLDLIKLVLQSFGGKATTEQIQQVLTPDVITDDWKKWWEMAKREMRKDGHFLVPLKKTEPVVYQVKETSLQDRLTVEFREAKGLKAKLVTAGEALKSVADLADKQAAVTEIINGLNADIASHQRTLAALALEAIFLRDDLRAAAGLAAPESDLTAAAIWSQNPRLGQLLDAMPAAKYRRTLQSFLQANPATWHETLLAIMNTVPAKVCGECAQLLVHEGRLDELHSHLARLISQHTANSELLLWLGKDGQDSFADLLGPEVFRAMLTAMERDQFNEKRANRLRDYVLADQELLVELIGSADLEVIKDLTRALQLSAAFDDMDKRSLLARIVKNYPEIQSLITGEATKQDTALIVSWDSLERRRTEYEELVKKKIPANSKDIAIARSYGDLRENHEFKAAKETQKVLMHRKAELERDLVRSRGTDYANPRTDVASIGTRVHVTDLGTQHAETFSIVGAWDGDPEKGIISYLTPMGQALLNQPVGQEVDFELGAAKKRFRIESIEAVKHEASVGSTPAAEHGEPHPVAEGAHA